MCAIGNLMSIGRALDEESESDDSSDEEEEYDGKYFSFFILITMNRKLYAQTFNFDVLVVMP